MRWLDLLVISMNKQKAEEIARNLLSQNYSVLQIVKSNMENNVWTVEVLVSSFDKTTVKKIKIDDKTKSVIKIE